MTKIKFQFNLSGLLIGLILISMFATLFSTFMIEVNNEYNLTGVNSFEKYNATQKVITYTEEARNSTAISQDTGILDIIGAYFTRGYAALKTSLAIFPEIVLSVILEINTNNSFEVIGESLISTWFLFRAAESSPMTQLAESLASAPLLITASK